MSDEHPRTLAPISFTPAAITLAMGCAGLTLSLGLCGLGMSLSTRGSHKGDVLMPLALVLFGVSLLAIFISIVWLFVVVIMNGSRSSEDGAPPAPPASH